ncbi:hypothetical protein J2T14_004524 [Paenibacillus harenae]|nr:hypothetical protein [Paenibacillus harenae]
MNKYWSAIICVFLICSTVLVSVYYIVDTNKYQFANHGENDILLKYNKKTDETWSYSLSKGWMKIE